ncbi:beta-L-arabinofuranosidase domain-containing protein, partial [Anaeromassilibacillus sp. Marseille-P3371]|uniref:beta-L-arabinofuranosidase domain-containing protein n=1 Tax=Anaeromassilibacillus sp. Marseille-P3371 TaxID=1944639 RepID=UPI000A1C9E79
MKKKLAACLLSATILFSSASPAFAAPASATEPQEPAKSVDFTHVKITDDFWTARQKQFICKVIPTGISNVEKASGGIPNIINAAKMHRGEAYEAFQGAFYVDSDVHKVLESMCYALQIDPMGDEEILAGQQYIRDKLEEWIPYYMDAQEENGYFDTYFILGANGNTPKWWDFNLHELYCAGHFYEAAVAHYRATGGKDTRLFDMAIKNADYVCSLFGEGKWKQVPGHQEIELALVKLANLCEEIGGEYSDKAKDYIALAEFFLDTRGDFEDRHGTNHNSEYDQDHLPVTEQKEAVGHAVRAGYMYTAMADINLLEQDGRYDEALLALWDDIENKKTYVTGGIGSNPANEGYGSAYDLPNDTAYCETCANIANVMFNQRMNLLYGDSKYADVVERGLYNSIISCVDFEGETFFYGNPMSSDGSKHRSEWFGTACCPPNLMRTVESLGGYIYTQQGDILTQNLYIGNEATLQVDGKTVRLHTDTDMPWEGTVSIAVDVDQPTEFTFRLRVPSWATDENTLSVNGETVSAEPDEQGYVVLDRTWNEGDSIDLNFTMETKRVYSDPRVEANQGRVAVKRGPIVYAAEDVDNEYPVTQYYLPKDATFTTKWIENLEDEKFDRPITYPPYVEANLNEDFEDAQAASSRWLNVDNTQTIEIANGKVHMEKGTNNKLVAGDEAWSDFAIEAQVTLGEDGTDSGNAGVLVRSSQEGSGPDNYHGYYFGIGLEGAEYGKANGSWTRFGKKTWDIELGKTYTLKVLAYQNTFLFFVDGEKVGSFKDLEHQAGRIGLRSYNREVTADNVTVRPLTDEEILLAQAPSEDPYQIKSTMQIVANAKVQVDEQDLDAPLVMTPYYAWDNRDSGAMAIHIREERVEFPLESYATPSASAVSQYDTIEALNDGTDARWTSYETPLNPWVQYDFEEPVSLWGCDIKWYDDNGGVQIPDGLEIAYWDGETFVPVKPVEEYNYFSKNAYDSYEFEPIITTKIRLNIKNDIKKIASGIMEWKLQGEKGVVDFQDIPLQEVCYGNKPYGTEYDVLNVADFTPVTAQSFRVLMDGYKPVGMKEFRLQKTDGTYAEQDATVSASYTCTWTSLDAVNDGKGWDTSDEGGNAKFTWSTYPNSGEHWVQYDFAEPITVQQAEICWYRAWDSGVIAPDTWKIQYEKDGEWVDVPHVTRSLSDFDNDVLEYTVKVPSGNEIPTVSAKVEEPYARISIQQAESIPGTAEITVWAIGIEDSKRTYRIHFVEETEKEPQLLTVQWSSNAAVEVEGNADVVISTDAIYGAKVMPGEDLTFTFTPTDGAFASAQLNGEDIPFESNGFTYTYTMPNESASLRFTFTKVDKDILKIVLDEANNVTQEDIDRLVPEVRELFVNARTNAQEVYDDPAATQEEVNQAWDELLEAMHLLEFEEGDKEVLLPLIEIAEQLAEKLDAFKPSSTEGFEEALNEAKDVYAEENPLKAEVDKAYENLQKAIENLKYRADLS